MRQDALLEHLLELPDPVVVSSFMRSGTHLTLDFLRANYAGFGARKLPLEANDNVYLPIDCLIDGTWSPRRAIKVLRRSGVALCKTHWSDPEFADIVASPSRAVGQWLQRRARVILVHRNPRRTIDSLVVWHFHHGTFDAPAIPSPLWLRERLREWRNRLEAWSATSRPVYYLASERLLSATTTVGREMGVFLGQAPIGEACVLPERLHGKWHGRWNRLLRTNPGSTEILTMRRAPKISWSREHESVLEDEVGALLTPTGTLVALPPELRDYVPVSRPITATDRVIKQG